uniref:Uncharacterized protein n=1 Tax=Solanum tuberosum TaxID=4113 RepID=M1DZ51_SOLTU
MIYDLWYLIFLLRSPGLLLLVDLGPLGVYCLPGKWSYWCPLVTLSSWVGPLGSLLSGRASPGFTLSCWGGGPRSLLFDWISLREAKGRQLKKLPLSASSTPSETCRMASMRAPKLTKSSRNSRESRPKSQLANPLCDSPNPFGTMETRNETQPPTGGVALKSIMEVITNESEDGEHGRTDDHHTR